MVAATVVAALNGQPWLAFVLAAGVLCGVAGTRISRRS